MSITKAELKFLGAPDFIDNLNRSKMPGNLSNGAFKSKPFQVKHAKVDVEGKRKVLFVIDTLQFGGAEQSLLANTMRFAKVVPIVCHLYEGDALKKQFVENGIKVYSLNIKKKYGFITAAKQLSELVKVEQPDIMVAYLTRSEIVTRLVGRFAHIPVIGTFISDLYSKTYNQHLSWKAKRLVSFFKLVNRFTSRYCVGFVANSHSVKHASSKQLSVPLHKVEVISRGRDSYKFKNRRFENDRPSGHISFVNVGRLFPVKGQKEMILGFKEFNKIYPDSSLSIIGDGPMRKELEEVIDANKLQQNVFLLGTRNDIPNIIAEFDCFVFPSFSEGFSGAIVEAMFAGLPILASDIPQNKEAIDHLKNGYLFPKESVNEITKALMWFKDNRPVATTFAKRAYEFAKENFELESTVLKFEGYLCDKIKVNN